MKKVIFIGGSSYSGTTMLDMILSNDPEGFSCGEIHALFYPYRKHHKKPTCGCGDSNCMIWENIKKQGVKNCYRAIFQLFPQITFIIDSSKNPLWIKYQMKQLQQQNISYKNILIWKHPLDIAASHYKRNQIDKWEQSWKNYHHLYFHLIQSFELIAYKDIIQSKMSLKKVCDILGIPFFEDKSRYWEKTQHTLFGNRTAKIHLWNQESSVFLNTHKQLESDHTEKYHNFKSIYYNNVLPQNLQDQIKLRCQNEKELSYLLKILEKKSCYSKKYTIKTLSIKFKQIFKWYFRRLI